MMTRISTIPFSRSSRLARRRNSNNQWGISVVVTSKALLITPETDPALATDRRPYVLATRANVAVKAAKVTVAQTAVELTASLPRRRKVYIKSVDGNPDVYIGGSGVDADDGYLIVAKGEIWLDITPGAQVFGITDTGTADVRVLEAGV